MRLLLVEDDPTNRALVRAVLERASPSIPVQVLTEASTLAEARGHLALTVFDVMLLDVQLPDGSGLELARELLSDRAERPRILVMSASVRQAEQDAALAAGGDAFLTKPFMPSELVAAIRALMDGSTGPRTSD